MQERKMKTKCSGCNQKFGSTVFNSPEFHIMYMYSSKSGERYRGYSFCSLCGKEAEGLFADFDKVSEGYVFEDTKDRKTIVEKEQDEYKKKIEIQNRVRKMLRKRSDPK